MHPTNDKIRPLYLHLDAHTNEPSRELSAECAPLDDDDLSTQPPLLDAYAVAAALALGMFAGLLTAIAALALAGRYCT